MSKMHDNIAKSMANAFYVTTKYVDKENKCDLPDTAQKYINDTWSNFLPEAYAALDMVKEALTSENYLKSAIKITKIDISEDNLRKIVNALIFSIERL